MLEVSVFCLKIYLSCSQKRKSEDLNGEDTNGQTELKKEEDDAEEVMHFYVMFMQLLMFKH